MITFRVDDMSCGHCVQVITQAVQSVDPAAEVDVDLAQHQVRIAPASAGADELKQAISEAGYTPVAG
jgi:copper chaperone